MKKSNILDDINHHKLNFIKWDTIKKDYPDKWVFLGLEDESIIDNAQLDVLCVAETFEEINDFEAKYEDNFWAMGHYKGFATLYTATPKKSKEIVVPFYAITTITKK